MSKKNNDIAIWCAHDAVLPLSELKPNPRNPNKHPPEQIKLLAKIIGAQGWRNPIVVSNRSGLITKGHGRLDAARLLNTETAPVDYQDYGSESEELADMIADNRIAELAEADRAMLRDLAEQLDDGAFDMDLTGFDQSALEELMTAAPPESDVDAEPQIDKAEELAAKWKVKRGQIWELGEHRLMCGDCRVGKDVDALISEARINVAFTSPPYASQRDYDESSGFKPIPPDEFVEWFDFVQTHVRSHLAEDGSWFVNIKPSCDGPDTSLYVFDLVIAHARKWGWHFATEFCWERNGVPKSVTQRFKNQFEPIYQFALERWKMRPDSVRHESANVPRAGGEGVGNTSWKTSQGGNGQMFGAAKKRKHGTTQLMSDTQGVSAAPGEYIGPGLAYPGNRLPTFTSTHNALGHAAAFPVGLPEFFIKAYSDPGDNVYEPFLGSGSTVIACERTKRRGFGMEISANYVAVAIQRWADATGKTPKLLK